MGQASLSRNTCASVWSEWCGGRAGAELNLQSSLLLLLLRGSEASRCLFFSLSSTGRKWASVRMNPRKFTWSSLRGKQNNGCQRLSITNTRSKNINACDSFHCRHKQWFVWRIYASSDSRLSLLSLQTKKQAWQTPFSLHTSVGKTSSVWEILLISMTHAPARQAKDEAETAFTFQFCRANNKSKTPCLFRKGLRASTSLSCAEPEPFPRVRGRLLKLESGPLSARALI